LGLLFASQHFEILSETDGTAKPNDEMILTSFTISFLNRTKAITFNSLLTIPLQSVSLGHV